MVQRTPFLPAHLEVGAARGEEPRDVAIFIHGILGSAANWRSFARRLAEHHPSWLMVLVDLRNHGESAGAQAPHTVAACAADVAALVHARGWSPALVCGHSFGGKVALHYARDHAHDLDEVWLIDAPLGAMVPSVSDHPSVADVRAVLEAIRAVPTPLPSRAALVPMLVSQGLAEPVAQWLTTNLRVGEGGYRWRFDLAAVEEMLADYVTVDAWDVVERPPAGLRVHAVRGGRSDRLRPRDLARLEAAGATAGVYVHTLPTAGHWVHADDPDGLLKLLGAALTRLGSRPH